MLACTAVLLAVAPAAPAHAAPRPAVSSTTAPSPARTAKYGRFGLPLAHDGWSTAEQQLVLQRRSATPATLSAIERIAREPTANWYGGSADTVASGVRFRVDDAAARHSIAQLVVFDLPHRGCDGVVEPGPQTAAEYRTWFRAFLSGLGQHRAIVIMEPDALGLASCLPHAQRVERYALIKWAVQLLHRQGSWAYIDAGHSKWLSVKVAAHRLRMSGIASAAGFSLNVSNFRPDAELIRYGAAVSKLVGGRHFVIDSGRNGAPAATDAYCNPPGKALGHLPTERTGVDRLDAYLWIKDPGSSDGTCNGGPAAGHWWQRYALMLVRNTETRR